MIERAQQLLKDTGQKIYQIGKSMSKYLSPVQGEIKRKYRLIEHLRIHKQSGMKITIEPF